jgi:hypothetical protein
MFINLSYSILELMMEENKNKFSGDDYLPPKENDELKIKVIKHIQTTLNTPLSQLPKGSILYIDLV